MRAGVIIYYPESVVTIHMIQDRIELAAYSVNSCHPGSVAAAYAWQLLISSCSSAVLFKVVNYHPVRALSHCLHHLTPNLFRLNYVSICLLFILHAHEQYWDMYLAKLTEYMYMYVLYPLPLDSNPHCKHWSDIHVLGPHVPFRLVPHTAGYD